MEDVQQVCIDYDFDEDKIDAYLKFFEIDEKYKGLAAYEWKTTQTREEKVHERRRKQLEEERKMRHEEREREYK